MDGQEMILFLENGKKSRLSLLRYSNGLSDYRTREIRGRPQQIKTFTLRGKGI